MTKNLRILMGFDETVKGYRLYDPEIRDVITSRDVVIIENKAEYIALTADAKEALFLRNLIYELTGSLICVKLYNDNQSAQKLAKNGLVHKRSKHIDLRYHYIREVVSKNFVKLDYLKSEKMIADVLTKSLLKVKHNAFVEGMGLATLS